MIYDDSLRSLSLASLHSGGISLFGLAHGSGGHDRGQQVQAARPNIRVYRACAVCRCVLVRTVAHTVAWCNTFHEGLRI